MKFLHFVFVASCFSWSLFAHDTIIAAFRADKNVQVAIENAKADYHFNIESTPQVLSLNMQCGVVGRVTQYLVGLPLTTSGVNPRSKSIIALVKVLNTEVKKISLISDWDICALQSQNK